MAKWQGTCPVCKQHIGFYGKSSKLRFHKVGRISCAGSGRYVRNRLLG